MQEKGRDEEKGEISGAIYTLSVSRVHPLEGLTESYRYSRRHPS